MPVSVLVARSVVIYSLSYIWLHSNVFLFLGSQFTIYCIYECSGQPLRVHGGNAQVKSPPPPPRRSPPPQPPPCGSGLADGDCSTAGVQSSCCSGYICTRFLVSSGQNVLRCSKSPSSSPPLAPNAYPPPRPRPPPSPAKAPPAPPCGTGSTFGDCKVEGSQDLCCPGYTCTLVRSSGGVTALQCKGRIKKNGCSLKAWCDILRSLSICSTKC